MNDKWCCQNDLTIFRENNSGVRRTCWSKFKVSSQGNKYQDIFIIYSLEENSSLVYMTGGNGWGLGKGQKANKEKKLINQIVF